MISVPAQLLKIAAGFIHKDRTIGALNAVCLRLIPDPNKELPDLSRIEITATNGHIAFRVGFFVNCEDAHTWHWDDPDHTILLPAKACKAPADAHISESGTITYNDQYKNMLITMPSLFQLDLNQQEVYPSLNGVFPSIDDFKYDLDRPIGFNGSYMALIGNTVAKYTDNGLMVMRFSSATTSALVTADLQLEVDPNVTYRAEFIIMPIRISS